MIHALKIKPEFFESVLSGKKTFESRLCDRDYRVGDLLALNEYDDAKGYTGRCCLVKIDYILDDVTYNRDGYVIMSIKPCFVSIHDEFNCMYNRDPFTVPMVERSPIREVVE